MKKFGKIIAVVSGLFLMHNAAFATSFPNDDEHVSFLGPEIKARFTNRLVENWAYSLAAEAAPRNLRVSGTYAYKFNDCQRLKITGEYLWQYINYSFISSTSNAWVNQLAVGLAYEQDFTTSWMRPSFDLSIYGSYAPNKQLGNITGAAIDAIGTPVIYSNERRIAGSDAGGISPGFALTPWYGGRVSAALNWDKVRYNIRYQANHADSTGFGGTLSFNQAIFNYLNLGATASVRQAYNNYSANILFTQFPLLGAWTVGIFGNYVDGKRTLPSTYNVGVSADYYLDQSREDCGYNRRGYADPVNDKMLQFVAVPAVYMPQVLAVPDSALAEGCNLVPVQYLGTPGINPGLPVTTAAFTFGFGPLFTGQSIVYSLSVITNGSGSPTDFSINPNSGLLSYGGGTGNYTLTVVGSNSCGSASVTFNYVN